jgi:hypothetical protein
MWRKILGILIILVVLPGASFASSPSETLVTDGRALLFQNGNPTYQGILDANEKFKAAVGADPLHQEAHLFYAVTRLVSFVLNTSDGTDFQTLADIIQAMGIPIYLDKQLKDNSPFGHPPELDDNLNLPETMPNGNDLRNVLSPKLLDVIDQALENLDAVDDTINVVLTAQEIDDLTDIEVDFTDVLLAKAFLNTFKTLVSIISAYDLDGADIRELMAFANSGMMNLHPNMINELLAKYPNFLRLADNGADLLSSAKTAFQSAYARLVEAHDSLNQEEDNQNDDLFSYESEEDEQAFENVLNGFSELIDSLADNRAATIENVKSHWYAELGNGDTLNFSLEENRLENGSVVREGSNFWGEIDGNNIQGWIPYWKIIESNDQRNIKIILDYWGYKRIELTGVLMTNDTMISGTCSFQENYGSEYNQTETSTFTADISSQLSDDIFRLDLNALFGNTEKDELDIRKYLPDFDMSGEPKADSFLEPIFNGLFPDYSTKSALDEEINFEAPYKVFTIPTMTPDMVDADPSVWPAGFLVNHDPEDDFFPGWTQVQGMNIINTYLAKDDDFLYVAMELVSDPMTGYPDVNYPVYYQFEIRKSQYDWNRNTFKAKAYYNQYSSEWNVIVVRRDSNGNYLYSETLSQEYVSAENSLIKWKVPLSSLDGLETYGGHWIYYGTWSSWINQDDWVDGNTRLDPVYKILGSVSVPDGYTNGKIYLYLTESEYPYYGDDAILGTYIESSGNFELTGAPYSSTDLYVHVLWDTDGNGIPNSGDYTGMTGFKIQGDVNVGDIQLFEIPPPPDLPLGDVSVKSVHSGDNQFRTFFDIMIGQDFPGDLPSEIDTITITYPDGTNHQVYPDGGAYWDSYWNEFFLEIPGNPQLGEYVFIVNAEDGSVGIKSDVQKDLITIPIVDVNNVKIDTSSKTPVISWDTVSVPGTGLAYKLEVKDMAGDLVFWTGRDWDMSACSIPGLEPGTQYQYRIRAVDDSNWIQVDNRSHTNWITFTMDNELTHEAVPAVDLDGWGAVNWAHVGSDPGIDLWIKVIDHDGVAYDGSSHYVYARPIDESGNLIGDDSVRIDLNFDYSENGTQGYYYGGIDSANLTPDFAGVRFFAIDPDDVEGTTNDFILNTGITPPAEIVLACTVNNGTTPTFTWNAFMGANHYRVRIFDEDLRTVWKGYPGNVTSYTLPAGILEPYTTYRYRLDARDAHSGFETDYNLTSHSSDNYPVFTTGARVDKPFINGSSTGVETWSDNYRGTITSYWIRVYDAQGVPGNIQKVKVVHPDTTTETELYYEYNESSNCAIYSNNSYEAPQEGSYTFVAMDKDEKEFRLTEELVVNPMGYPVESSLSVQVNGTGAEFDWDDVDGVPGAGFYRLEIYNKQHERILKFVTTESHYTLAPGFLAKGELYGFRVTTRREFWDQNTDNGSSSPWTSDWAINFKTEPVMDNGSNLPGIDTNNFGADVIYLQHPITGEPYYWLEFSVNVTDQDGVPGNIKSVTVEGPGITGSLNLNYGSPGQRDTAEYWNTLSYDSYEAIPEGPYTFRVEDENWKTATTKDTLVKKPVPLAPYLTPADGAVISSDRPVIDWTDPVGGPYFYKVRIYQHWNKLIHESGILNSSIYSVPGDILKPGELYGYRIHTYDNNPDTTDVDNISLNQIFFANQNHFTIIDGDRPSLTEIFKLINILIGNSADISSFEMDINQDDKLDMKDVIPVLQEAGDLR